MSHTITVTKLADDDSDDYGWTLNGTHDQNCEAWWECDKAWHRHPLDNSNVGDEWGNKRVGEHMYIDGLWCVQRGCGYTYADHGDMEYDLAARNPKIGDEFELIFEWDEAWYITLGPQVEVSRDSQT